MDAVIILTRRIENNFGLISNNEHFETALRTEDRKSEEGMVRKGMDTLQLQYLNKNDL